MGTGREFSWEARLRFREGFPRSCFHLIAVSGLPAVNTQFEKNMKHGDDVSIEAAN